MCADPALLPTSSLYFIVTCTDWAFLPPSVFTLSLTCANRGFLLPSFDSRVQIAGFRPRRLIYVCRSGLFAPVGFHGCCPELCQEPAQLRVLRKRNSSGKASSDAGPELAGRAAERRWKARRP